MENPDVVLKTLGELYDFYLELTKFEFSLKSPNIKKPKLSRKRRRIICDVTPRLHSEHGS